MNKFQIIFCDEIDTHVITFKDFESAVDYWQKHADTPTYFAGELKDLETGEIIWSFDDATPCDAVNDKS